MGQRGVSGGREAKQKQMEVKVHPRGLIAQILNWRARPRAGLGAYAYNIKSSI